MMIPKGTKIIIDGVKHGNTTVLTRETTYLKLAETVEGMYKDKKVVGYKRYNNTVTLYTADKEDATNYLTVNKGDTISFVANDSLQYFYPHSKTEFSSVKASILLLYRDVKEDTFRINGKLVHDKITKGYLFFEELPDWSECKSFYKIKNLKEVLALNIKEGDILNIDTLASFKIKKVVTGNGLMTITVSG